MSINFIYNLFNLGKVNASFPMDQFEIDFKSMQKSFYIATTMEVIAAMCFLLTTFFVIQDWDKALWDEQGKQIINFTSIYK